jgi:hypothetical protein
MHPEITIWHNSFSPECTVPSHILPNVRDLSAPAWILPQIQRRPLTHLTLMDMYSEDERLLEMLSSLKATLRVLHIQRDMRNHSLASHALIGTLAKYVPTLEKPVIL